MQLLLEVLLEVLMQLAELHLVDHKLITSSFFVKMQLIKTKIQLEESYKIEQS